MGGAAETKQGKRESGSDELDVDEKVVNKTPITQSHGCRSFKKPTSTRSNNQKAIVFTNTGGQADDHDSVYTGKSFYDCPT